MSKRERDCAAALIDAPIINEVPATLWLFSIGLLGMGAARKRKAA